MGAEGDWVGAQVTMAYGYWKAGMHEVPSVFDLFFRKCPFKGEFAVFAGLQECVRFLHVRGKAEGRIGTVGRRGAPASEPCRLCAVVPVHGR